MKAESEAGQELPIIGSMQLRRTWILPRAGTSPATLADLLALIPKLTPEQQESVYGVVAAEISKRRHDGGWAALIAERDAANARADLLLKTTEQLARELDDALRLRPVVEAARNIRNGFPADRCWAPFEAALAAALRALDSATVEAKSEFNGVVISQEAFERAITELEELRAQLTDAQRRLVTCGENFAATVELNRKLRAEAATVAARQREACARAARP